MNSIWFDVLDRCLMFAMLGLAANVVLGVAGQMSLATAAFFGIGAYTQAVLTIDHGTGFFQAALISVLVSTAVGAVLALPTMRVRGEYVVLLTLAFLQVVNQMQSSWIDLTGGATGKFPIPTMSLFGFEPRRPADFVVVLTLALMLMLVLTVAVVRSPYGRSLRAIRDDESAASAYGLHVFGYHVSVFALSAGLAGLVGVFWAHYFAFITPSAFDLDQTIFVAAIVVLGGMGSMWGSVAAAFVLVSLPQVLRSLEIGSDHSSQIQQVIYGLLLIIFMAFRPQGLFRERSPKSMLVRPVDDPGLVDAHAIHPTELHGTAVGGQPVSSGDVVLEARGVSKTFDGLKALDDISITVERGVVTALVGPNGAGKTTLFNVLTGDLQPDSGTVLMNGIDITGERPDQIVRRGVGRTFQDVRLFGSMTAVDNVVVAIPDQRGVTLLDLARHPVSSFSRRSVPVERAHAALDEVGFEGARGRAVAELGYGEQKLVALARLLASDPVVVLLDEPSAGTDPAWVERVLDVVRQLARSGRAVCIVEHNLDLIRKLDGNAYFLDEGRLVARGSVDELMGDRRLLETYLGV